MKKFNFSRAFALIRSASATVTCLRPRPREVFFYIFAFCSPLRKRARALVLPVISTCVKGKTKDALRIA